MTTETKWTPGPWHVSPPTRENPSRAMVSALSGGVSIYDAPLTSETEANARLIAAAPQMAEALQLAFAALAITGNHFDYDNPRAAQRALAEFFEHHAEKARAALRSAGLDP